MKILLAIFLILSSVSSMALTATYTDAVSLLQVQIKAIDDTAIEAPIIQIAQPIIQPEQQIVLTSSSVNSGKAVLKISGQAHSSQIYQQVKAISCQEPSRDKNNLLQPQCSAPIYFSLNQEQELAPGNYIIGFSNTIYPGFVSLSAGQRKEISLSQIPIISSSKDREIRIYRNFTSLIEQKKIYFTLYYLSSHFFKLAQYNFGDYYLTQTKSSNVFSAFDQRSCSRMDPDSRWSDFAKLLCNTYLTAQSMMDLSDFFSFETNDKYLGQFQEAFIWSPGDIFSVRYMKHLVSLPLDPSTMSIASGDSLAVFPGSYTFQSIDNKGQKKIRNVKTDDQVEYYTESQLKKNMNPPNVMVDQLSAIATASDVDAAAVEPTDLSGTLPETVAPPFESEKDKYMQKCMKARLWKTESRSYCSADNQEGCDRSTVSLCEPMNIIDFRFRKK